MDCEGVASAHGVEYVRRKSEVGESVQRSDAIWRAERRRAKEEGRSGRTLFRFCGWAGEHSDWARRRWQDGRPTLRARLDVGWRAVNRPPNALSTLPRNAPPGTPCPRCCTCTLRRRLSSAHAQRGPTRRRGGRAAASGLVARLSARESLRDAVSFVSRRNRASEQAAGGPTPAAQVAKEAQAKHSMQAAGLALAAAARRARSRRPS